MYIYEQQYIFDMLYNFNIPDSHANKKYTCLQIDVITLDGTFVSVYSWDEL